jgi:hypothetical protein
MMQCGIPLTNVSHPATQRQPRRKVQVNYMHFSAMITRSTTCDVSLLPVLGDIARIVATLAWHRGAWRPTRRGDPRDDGVHESGIRISASLNRWVLVTAHDLDFWWAGWQQP